MSNESQTFTRGLQLLELLGSGHAGASVRDLAAALDLPKSIVQRLLNSLDARGFVARHSSGVGYRLTAKLWALGSQAISSSGLQDVARPHLRWLNSRTLETVKLSVLEGASVISVDCVESSQAVRAYVPVGGSAPAALAATGKAILAFRDSIETGEHASIRRRGYAVNKGEWQPGVGAVAAPVFDSDGNVLASVGVILPLLRLKGPKTAELGSLCIQASSRISEELGFDVKAAGRKRKAG